MCEYVRVMDTQTDTASPADKVISTFGTLTKTAMALGKPITTVQGWKDRKRIPPEHWREIIAAAEAAGKKLTLDDFIPDRAA